MIRIIFSLLLVLFATTLTAKSILVLGDSLSAGYGIKLEEGWVALLQQKLNEEKKFYTLINESISGDTSAGGLARIDDILTRYKPEIMLLELGANDGLRGLSPKIMKHNLEQIILRAKKRQIRVLLLAMRIPPNYGKRYVDMFYNVYPSLAKEMNIPYVPFILENIALDKKMMQKDGLHPNAKAQPLIMDKIWKHFIPILAL